MFVYPHVQPISRTLTGASTVQYQHSEALFFFFCEYVNYMWYYFFAFKYRPNEGNNIFLNLVSVVLYSSSALKKKGWQAQKVGVPH